MHDHAPASRVRYLGSVSDAPIPADVREFLLSGRSSSAQFFLDELGNVSVGFDPACGGTLAIIEREPNRMISILANEGAGTCWLTLANRDDEVLVKGSARDVALAIEHAQTTEGPMCMCELQRAGRGDADVRVYVAARHIVSISPS